MIGSDASGLSDPFARIIVGEFCKTTQVIDETLSPTWDELLIFDDILLYGTRDEIQKDPITIVIEIFDQDKVGKSEFIGRTLAKPHVKLAEDPYCKPKFPPSLDWYEITRGPDRAGELLATFELLEITNCGSENVVLPALPSPKHRDSLGQLEDLCNILPVPRGVRPTLAKYRIEVLFWGLRDLKRIHLLTVDRPRVDIECAGNILSSSVIQNAKRNPNFSNPVKFMELELPEQELYRPPLTVRVVDCRSFGRYTLVGTHMINSVHKYMYQPMTRQESGERKEGNPTKYNSIGPNNNSTAPAYSNKENSPLLPRNTTIFIGYGTSEHEQVSKRDLKNQTNKKRRHDSTDTTDSNDDESSKDWWTKYFASYEAMIEETKLAKKSRNLQQNGSVPAYLNDWHKTHNPGYKSDTQESGEGKRKLGLKGAATAAKFVAKLSPRSIRKRHKNMTALFKV